VLRDGIDARGHGFSLRLRAMDDLDRMFRLLVRNTHASAPDYLSRPFELAELYQNLIPYRHHRRELGIETNEDYELALTRMLAGERGYLVSEPDVQRALQRELGSPNPDTTAFRQFAHTQVGFAADALQALGAGDGMPRRSAPMSAPMSTPMSAPMSTPMNAPLSASMAGSAGAMGSAPMAPPPLSPSAPPAPPPLPPSAPNGGGSMSSTPPLPPPMPSRPSGASGVSSRPSGAMSAPPPVDAPVAGRMPLTIEAQGTCRYCGGQLPDGRRITFCPHCGQNLTVQHCQACGTELEVGWKFCVTCGRASG
jgi:hypothetical protein